MENREDLEKRLAECRKAMAGILESLNYIQEELDKEKNKEQNAGQQVWQNQPDQRSTGQQQPPVGQQNGGFQSMPQQPMAYTQQPNGYRPMGQSPIGHPQQPVEQAQMGQPQPPMGQAPMGYIQQPNGYQPMGQHPIGQSQQPMGQAPMGYTQQPNGYQPMGQSPIGQPQPPIGQPQSPMGQQQNSFQPMGQMGMNGMNRQQYGGTAMPNSGAYQYNNIPKQDPKVKDNKETKSASSAESVLGKNVMAITASVLIFISLVLFATLIIPKLNYTAKFLLMLVVSIGITAFGLIKWFKNKESNFFISVGACGIGAIYISLFLSNIYFGFINDITLFVLLLAWAAGVLYLSKYKKLLFEIIGCFGIAISVTFGAVKCINTDAVGLFVLVCIYAVIGVLAFMAFRIKDNVSYLITNICSVYCLFVLYFSALSISRGYLFSGELGYSESFPMFLVLALISLGFLVYNRVAANEKNKVWIGFFGAGYSLFLTLNISNLFEAEEATILINLFLAVGTYIGLEYHLKKILNISREAGDIFWQILLFIIALACIGDMDFMSPTIGLAIMSAGLIIYGFMTNDNFSKILGLISNGFVLCYLFENVILMLVAVVVLFAIETALLYIKNDQYNPAIKIVTYLIFLTGIAESIVGFAYKEWIGEAAAWTVALVVLGLINIIAMKSLYRKNWEVNEDDKATLIALNIVNAILMLYSLGVMCTRENELEHWVAVLMGILLFMINSFNLLKNNDVYAALYVGFKGTVLLITILLSFKASGAVLSIAVFVLAIVLIIIGFKYETKGLRIYGLVIALICAVKLVMVDITYQNTVGHAISFFVSGILCFAISFIYSFVEKKYKNEALGEDK